MEEFPPGLPRTSLAAWELAERSERWTPAPDLPIEDHPLRHALEIRHPSFLQDAFLAQLRRHGVALVVADAAGLYPLVEEATADLMYVRLHGSRALYSGSSTRPELEGPQEVCVFFGNDVGAHAPADVARPAGFHEDLTVSGGTDPVGKL